MQNKIKTLELIKNIFKNPLLYIKYTEYILKMIKEYEGEVKPLGSNLLTPYVVLYYQIKQSIEFIEQYKYNIGQIK